MKHIVTVLCVLSALIQGGFPDSVWALCGVAAVVFLLFRAAKRPPLPVVIFMAMLILAYVISALLHGLSYEALAAVGRLTVSCLLLLVFCNIDADVYETVFASGFVVAAIGFATFCGLFHLEGAVLYNRLQSVFQYANAAGLFLGAAAFLTCRHEKWSAFSPFLETALLLTQSVGALIVYMAGWAALLLTDRRVRFSQFLCGLSVSLFSAGMTYMLVYAVKIPLLAILPPIALLVFRNKLQRGISAVSLLKGISVVGSCIYLAAVAVLFFLRGLSPFITYLDRLVQISDGLRLMTRHPLGIGPGVWQFHFPAYQSAHFYAAKIHSEYVAVGVDAGFLAFVPLLLLLFYWGKRQKWGDKSICAGMILFHAVLDIPFSFLPVVMIMAILLTATLPEPKALSPPSRALFALPLALFAVMVISSVIKNRAARIALAGDAITAASILDTRPIRNDTEAILTQMSLYLDMEAHDKLERAFADMARPNAVAYSQITRSLIREEAYPEAAAYALACAEQAPYSPLGYTLLEQVLPKLDAASQIEYHKKMELLKNSAIENPLFTYKTGFLEE